MTISYHPHLDRWHSIVFKRDMHDLQRMLAENVIFYSPFLWNPYHGRQAAWLILATVSEVFQDFAYHRELVDENNWALEFSARVGDLSVKGIDLIRLDDAGLIVEFEVFIRPANGLQALGAEMSRRLGKYLPDPHAMEIKEKQMTFLRFIHIFSATFWVGTTLFMVFFMEPTVRSLGPDGGKFMQRLIGGTRFSLVMALSGWITILAGLLLYGPVTGWTADVILRLRLPLTLGAIAGIAAGIVGTLVQGRASGRLLALGQEVVAKGGPPSQAQAEEMQRLQARLRLGSRLSALLMVLAVIGMTW